MSRGGCARGVTWRACSLLKRPQRRGALLLAASASGALLLASPPAATAEPVSTSPPVISGALEVEHALTASTGTWTDAASPIVSYAYQWLRCNQDECTNIDYATANPYTLPWSFAGYQAEVTVTATDAQGESSFATSEMTNVIAPGPSYTLGESAVGNGSVTGFEASPEAAGKTADANLSCPGACGALYPYLPGTGVELIATPAAGAAFLGWGGACSGSAPTCSLTLGRDVAAVATFSRPATTSPVLPAGYENQAGGAQPPEAGAPSWGAWGASASSGTGLPARLLGIHYRRRHIQAEVRCEMARPCRLSLAFLAKTFAGQVMIAGRSFTIAARRSGRVTLHLNRLGGRILAKRHRLRGTAQLTLSASGHSTLIEQRRLTLVEPAQR
jgi:hypothetical protein